MKSITTNDFKDALDHLTDMEDWEFKEIIKIAKQYRRANDRMARALAKKQAMVEASKKAAQRNTGGLRYELA